MCNLGRWFVSVESIVVNACGGRLDRGGHLPPSTGDRRAPGRTHVTGHYACAAPNLAPAPVAPRSPSQERVPFARTPILEAGKTPNSPFERVIGTSSRRGGGTDLTLPTRMMAGRDPQGPVLGSEAVVQASPCATRAAWRVSLTGSEDEIPNPRNWVTVKMDPPKCRGGDQETE